MNKILLFKYLNSEWNIEEIKGSETSFKERESLNEKECYYQTKKPVSYGVEVDDGDTCICMSVEDLEINFLCKIRFPSTEGIFDYVSPLFLNTPLKFSEEISDEKPYKLFKPSDKELLTLVVLFDLSEFPDYLDKIKQKIIELNPSQADKINSYF